MSIEEIDDKLNSLMRQRDKNIIEINKLQEDVLSLLNKKYELDPQMVRVNCIQCGGLGRVKGEDGKPVICPVCNGEGYNWMKIYAPPEDK